MIHASASAGPNDAGWVDLTPNLKNAPIQVNLLGIPDSTCFLATLGDLGITDVYDNPGGLHWSEVIVAATAGGRDGEPEENATERE